jgi:diguanylate cyclase (GGDEF)-like protein/PAS domain S-box-containing protein
MELYELLNAADQGMDEGTLYDRGKVTLNALQDLARATETLPALTTIADSRPYAGLREKLKQLHVLLETYRGAAVRAVEMATVDLRMASRFLTAANERFARVHKAFAELIELAGENVNRDAAAAAQAATLRSLGLGGFGMLTALALVLFSYFLARLLSRTLKEQIEVLTRLSEGDTEVDRPPGHRRDEIGRMDRAINVFRESLLRIREQEDALSRANRRLGSEVEERKSAQQALQQVHDELEGRVRRRTRSLAKANKALHAEIESRIRAEGHLRIYQQVIEHTGEAVIVTDLNGDIVEVNPAYLALTGCQRDEVLGHPARMLRSGRHSTEFYERLWDSLTERGHWSGEIWERRKDGASLPMWATINSVRDGGGDTSQYVALFRDISALKQAEERLEQMAFYDPLTGLPNRVLFTERLAHALEVARRDNGLVALIFIDLDRFKYVNDTLGHSAGDQLLEAVARRLTGALRASDTVARMGGDEFTVVLPDIETSDKAGEIAGELIAEISQPVTIGEHQIYVGASAGISLFPVHGRDSETLKKRADMAMYRAKEGGRGQHRMFSPELVLESDDFASLSSDLIEALAKDELFLEYQPLVNLTSGEVVEREALIRWDRPGHGSVSPARLIRYAEDTGLIDRIDRWVLNRACREAQEVGAEGAASLPLSVNISSKQFQNPEIPEMLADILQRTGLAAERLTLEVTETAIIADPEAAGETLKRIRALGARVSLDDFGTGYSSLSYLIRFPLNRLKIHHGFVAGLPDDTACEAIVRSVLDLGQSLGIEVVAEGVESQGQHDFLRNMGCELGQGYFYAAASRDAALADIQAAGAGERWGD